MEWRPPASASAVRPWAVRTHSGMPLGADVMLPTLERPGLAGVGSIEPLG